MRTSIFLLVYTSGQRPTTIRYPKSHPEHAVREFLFYFHVNIYSYTLVQVVGLEAIQTPTYSSIFLLSFNIYIRAETWERQLNTETVA